MITAGRLQSRMERATARWWFFLIVVVLQFLPPLTSVAYDQRQTSEVIGRILGHAYAYGPAWRPFYPVLNTLAVAMLAGLFLLRNRWVRVFAAYAAASYVLFAFAQNMGDVPGLGRSMSTNGVAMFLLVALAWLLEAAAGKTDLGSINLRRSWIIAPALLAAWYPVDPTTMMPNFSVAHLFTSPTGVAFCLTTPMFLTVLILCYPLTNVVTLRVTGIFGVIIALYNLLFVLQNPQRLWWNGVVHTPLFIISLYAVILGYRGCGGGTAVEEPTA